MTEAYIVTGVGGYIGNRVAELLAERVDPASIIVTSRNSEALARWRERGVAARHADYDDPASLVAAFSGGTRMLMVSGMLVGERRRRQHAHAVDAAQRADVRHIVYTSYLGAGQDGRPALVAEDHRFTEDAIRASGMTWSFMRNSQYADAMAEQQGSIAVQTGRSIGNTGDGQVAFVSRDDVAAVAVELLLGAGETDTAYDVTGPELLTYRQVGELIAELSGTEIEIVDLGDEEMYAMWDSVGVPREARDDPDAPVPWCSDDMVSFGRTIREGGMAVRTDIVERFTGRSPETLRAVMERSAPAWSAAAPAASE